jgi:hypothetical protein
VSEDITAVKSRESALSLRLPSRLEQYQAKKSENLHGMQWTG